jgi:hypothetical protein
VNQGAVSFNPIMPPKAQSPKKVLVGDDTENLKTLLSQVIEEIGGPQALAVHIAKHLKDPNSNPYLQTRAFQTLIKIMTSVDSNRIDGLVDVPLSDEELEEVIVKDTVRFMVWIPTDMYDALLLRISEQRALYAMREEKARLAKENADRPVGQGIAGVTKSEAT